jgi:hypothetical protein
VILAQVWLSYARRVPVPIPTLDHLQLQHNIAENTQAQLHKGGNVKNNYNCLDGNGAPRVLLMINKFNEGSMKA